MWRFKSQERESVVGEEGLDAIVALVVHGDEKTSPLEGSARREAGSGRTVAMTSEVACVALYLVVLFIFLGIRNGYAFALNYVVGFVLLFAGVAALLRLSLDSRLGREGLTTTGTITGRKKRRQWCLRSDKFYVQYTYRVDGVEYRNPEGAWFLFHDPRLDDGDSDENGTVEVKYLPGHPEISLPMMVTAPSGNRRPNASVSQKSVSPSAGSLKKIGLDFGCLLNDVVFLLPYALFSVTATTVLKKFLHVQGELLASLFVHIMAVSAACLFYYCWMRRCERKQRFVALPELSRKEALP